MQLTYEYIVSKTVDTYLAYGVALLMWILGYVIYKIYIENEKPK